MHTLKLPQSNNRDDTLVGEQSSLLDLALLTSLAVVLVLGFHLLERQVHCVTHRQHEADCERKRADRYRSCVPALRRW